MVFLNLPLPIGRNLTSHLILYRLDKNHKIYHEGVFIDHLMVWGYLPKHKKWCGGCKFYTSLVYLSSRAMNCKQMCAGYIDFNHIFGSSESLINIIIVLFDLYKCVVDRKKVEGSFSYMPMATKV